MSVTRPSESGPLPYIATDEPWVAPEIDGSVHRRSFARRKPLAVVGVTILAIQRDGETLTNPWGGTSLQAGDLLITLGKPTQFAEAAPLFRS